MHTIADKKTLMAFMKEMKKTSPRKVLIYIYSPHCFHCTIFNDTWLEFVTTSHDALKTSNVLAVKMEYSDALFRSIEKESPAMLHAIRRMMTKQAGVPNIAKWFPTSDRVVMFTKERTLPQVRSFAK